MSFNGKIKKTQSDEAESVEKLLKEGYGYYLPDEIIREIAETIAREYIRRILVEVIEENGRSVKFLCNLSPAEMAVRKEEVRLLLPETSAADDYKYTIVQEGSALSFSETKPKRSSKKGWWEYYGFP